MNFHGSSVVTDHTILPVPYNERNNARCMQARKTTHGLDGQHQYVDRTLREKS